MRTFALTLILSSTGAFAAVDISKLPPPANVTIDFDQHIKPIFEKSCFQCHGPERPKSGFRLDQRETALKGGKNGVDIIPGKSAESPLIHAVSYLDEDLQMPPEGKAPRLTPEEVGLLRAWIDQGVKYGVAPTGPQIKFAVTSGFRFIGVEGDERKFREQNWTHEGWAGGIESLTLQGQTTNGTRVTAEARVMANDSDYLFKLRLEKPDFAFAQFGFQQYRRYTDDTGLSYLSYGFPAPQSDRGYFMDIGRMWVDVGLLIPDWPRITLGYEHQYRQGEKASVQYDFVTPDIALDAQGRALKPTRRLLDEDVHILKFDLEHEIAGVRIADSFRGELYNLSSRRDRYGVEAAATIAGNNGAIETDRLDHFQGANAFTLEKQLKSWLFLSGGYLYSRLDGGEEFERALFVPINPAVPIYLAENSQGILISQDTHAFSVTTLLGPWDGLSIFGALQNEWTHQDSLGRSAIAASLVAIPEPVDFASQISRATFNETIGLKYTKIPMTVLHADARLQQEDIGQAETYRRGPADAAEDFDRDTDARSWLQEYRGGFTVSPLDKLALTGDYKHRSKETDYHHLKDIDFDPTFPGDGYPAFITRRDILTDTIEAKVIVRPLSWLRATFKYENVSADFHTKTKLVQILGAGGGGPILAGNYDANVYSAGAILSPWQRLRLNATFIYTESRTISAVNNGRQIVPYEGDIYSVISGATFVLNAKTDLNATYYFSQANYAQPDTGFNTPFGLAYNRHGLLAGATYRWNPSLTTRIQYGLFRYDEPTTQAVNNYTAHAVFASVTWTMN
jgi:hypothetical protein